MISAFNRQSSGAAVSGDSSGQPEIVHFDATIRRKEKMRHLAGQDRPDSVAVAANGGKESLRADMRTAVRATDPELSRRQAMTGVTDPAARSAASSAPVQRQPAPGSNGIAPAVNAKPPQTIATAAEKPEAETISAETSASPEKLTIDISQLEAVLVNFVVEQTGYPVEMVELDADLEADLGIDSIKKAQMLGELAEQLNVKINISEDMSLDDFPTLRHITEFLRKAANETDASAAIEKTAVASPPASTIVPETPIRTTTTTTSKLNSADLQQLLVNFVVEQTGYPPEMVEMDADLEADLGIDSIKKAQMFGELAEQLNIQIKITEEMSLDDFPTLRHVLQALESAATDSDAADQVAATEIPLSARSFSADLKREEPRQKVPSDAIPVPSGATPVATVTGPAMAEPIRSSVSAATVQDVSDSTKPSASSLTPQELEAFLVNFVVEQTGYPQEMVELDADLEADLGIDSIKKAQLFGELAENLDVQIQITNDMSLDDYRTLRDVLNLLAQEKN